MLFTTLFVCFGMFLECVPQEVRDTEPMTSTVDAVSGDTTKQAVTLTIHDGRSGKVETAQTTSDGYSSLYSKQWKPMLMPISPPILDETARDKEGNSRLLPTFFRRPDSDLQNRTEVSPQSSNAVRYPTYASMLPMTPIFLLPRPDPTNRISWPVPADPTGGIRELHQQTGEDTKNKSASASTELLNEHESAESNANRENILPVPGGFPVQNPFLVYDYGVRNFGNAVSPGYFPVPPMYYPRQPPMPNAGRLNPVINIFMRPPDVDREPGSDAGVILTTPREFSSNREQVNPPSQDELIQHPVPPQSIAPEDLAPLPVRALPFGYLAPPLAHPVPLPILPLPPPLLPSIPQHDGPLLSDENLPAHYIPDETPPEIPITPEVLPNYLPENLPSGSLPDIPSVVDLVGDEKTLKEVSKTPYEFGFQMNDGKGTGQYRKETADESGVVTGSYGYQDPFGVYRMVNYIADQNGFHAFIKSNEPGVANPGSADVVVIAEQPPTRAVEEMTTQPEPEPEPKTDIKYPIGLSVPEPGADIEYPIGLSVPEYEKNQTAS